MAPDVSTEVVGERASSAGVLLFSAVLFVVVLACVLARWRACDRPRDPRAYHRGRVGGASLPSVAVISLSSGSAWWCFASGALTACRGPGLFWTIPVIESNTMRVDTRTRVTTFYAEETLTADLVPMNVDAVLFWHVWDAAAACTEVGDFTRAVEMAAQTALRDAIGRASAAEVAIRREQLDRELKRVLEEKVAPWGVTVLSVEVRDILLPKELQEAMSLEAQAEQRKKARIILMEAEHDIYEILDEMEELIGDHEAVSRLRTMHLLNESLREGKGTVVIPSAFAEGFNEGLGDLLKG